MQTIKVSQGGRVVIPAETREKYNINQGDDLVFEDRDGELVFTSKARRIEQIREELLAAMSPIAKGRSLADELIAERRTEAAKEDNQN